MNGYELGGRKIVPRYIIAGIFLIEEFKPVGAYRDLPRFRAVKAAAFQ